MRKILVLLIMNFALLSAAAGSRLQVDDMKMKNLGPQIQTSRSCTKGETIQFSIEGHMEGTWGEKFLDRIYEQVFFPMCDGRWEEISGQKFPVLPRCSFSSILTAASGDEGGFFSTEATIEPAAPEDIEVFRKTIDELKNGSFLGKQAKVLKVSRVIDQTVFRFGNFDRNMNQINWETQIDPMGVATQSLCFSGESQEKAFKALWGSEAEFSELFNLFWEPWDAKSIRHYILPRVNTVQVETRTSLLLETERLLWIRSIFARRNCWESHSNEMCGEKTSPHFH